MENQRRYELRQQFGHYGAALYEAAVAYLQNGGTKPDAQAVIEAAQAQVTADTARDLYGS